MKPFDIVGAVVVAAWLVLGGFYVYQQEFAQSGDSRQMAENFVMHSGETWLVLRRDDREVGFVHQTRTQLDDGWLVEYEMLLVLDLLGSERPIDTTVRSRLDRDGYLVEFTADISASSRDIEASGRVDGTTLHTSLNLSGEPRDRSIELDDRPRLSSSAFNQLLASGDLVVGETFEEKFFDPTTMQMTAMTMEYVGPDTVDVYEEEFEAHHIVQRLGSDELDVYVDSRGEILIQEFPLKIIASRVPAELGRTRASSIRRKLAERQKEAKASGESSSGGFEFSLDSAMRMLGGQASPDALGEALDEREEPDTDRPDTDQPDTDQPTPDTANPSE
ncbi:MAG: hypothetical protein ACLFVJ_16595 [Persicimonas sp.]